MWRRWNTKTWSSPSGTWVENTNWDLFGNTTIWTLKVPFVPIKLSVSYLCSANLSNTYFFFFERFQTPCVSSGGVCDRQLSQRQTDGGPQRARQAADGEGAERRPVAHLCQQTGTAVIITEEVVGGGTDQQWFPAVLTQLFLHVHVCRMFPAPCRWRRWQNCWACTSCAVGGAGTSRAAMPAVVWDSMRGWTGSPGSWWRQGSWTWPKVTSCLTTSLPNLLIAPFATGKESTASRWPPALQLTAGWRQTLPAPF